MMNGLSKMRQASRVRNSRATMIAAFMFGSVTLASRCQAEAPSTDAASCRSHGTCTNPASRSNEMDGVVFQISERMMTNSEVQRSPNQLKSPSPNHWLTKPESSWNPYLKMYAETTVMMPYGRRMPARTSERACRIRYITNANAKPRTSSTPSLTAVMMNVVLKSVHQTGSVSTVE